MKIKYLGFMILFASVYATGTHAEPVIQAEIQQLKSEVAALKALLTLMCAEKTGGFNLVNYRHSSGVYHEQETEDLHRRI